jgi:hypothetical protein
MRKKDLPPYVQQFPEIAHYMSTTLCRHCMALRFDKTSYASVLVTGGTDGVQTTIADLETRIVPCVTAVCPKCEHVSVLSDGTMESLLGTVYMWQRLREWIDT